MNRFVFPGRLADKPLSHSALAETLRRLGVDPSEATVHGFRSSFRDWCGDETEFGRDVAEAALAHRVGDAVERAYRRGSALQKRARLMQAWASFVTTPSPGAPIVNAHLRGCDSSPPETAVQARGRA